MTDKVPSRTGPGPQVVRSDSCSVPGSNIVSENGVMFVLAHMHSPTLSMRLALMFYVLKHSTTHMFVKIT